MIPSPHGRLSASASLLVALCAGPLALGAAACGKDRPAPAGSGAVDVGSPRRASDEGPPRLGELVIGDLTPADTRPEGVSEAAQGYVRAAFRDPEAFVEVPTTEEGACKASVSVGYALLLNGHPVLDADAGEVRALVEAEVFCPWEDEIDTFRASVDEERRFGGVDAAPWRARLDQAVTLAARRAARSLRGQIQTRHASDAQILEALSSATHDGILAEACAEAGERHLSAAIDALIRLTADERGFVAVRAGAALGLLGERRADVVAALAKMTRGPNEEKHLVAINALGDIGGEAAARYLDNLAVSHPNAALRELAREALRRARSKPRDAPRGEGE